MGVLNIQKLFVLFLTFQTNHAELSSFEKECLDEINKYRSMRWGEGKHQLIWDGGLAKDAQKWANHLMTTRVWRHAPNLQKTNVGELAWISRLYSGDDNRPRHAVNDWYEELCDYNDCRFSKYTGHATQLLWRDTLLVGCGKTHDKRGYHYVIARFWPCGNIDHPWYFSREVGCSNNKEITRLRNGIDCDAYHVRKRLYRNKI